MPGVDVEELVTNVLLDDAGIIALAGTRIYTDLPPSPQFPLGIVRRVGGTTDFLGHLDSSRIQFEAWARDKGSARDLAAEMLATALAMSGTFDEGIVTNASPLIGLTYIPDQPTGIPRYVFDLTVAVHPIPA